MNDKPLDLAASWRQMLSDWEKQTNAAMNGVAASPEFNKMMGQYMSAALRMQGMYTEGVERTLAKLNLPSRTDFTQINGQLSEIEARLDRLTASVEALVAAQGGAPATPGPRRTRKPPAPKAGG